MSIRSAAKCAALALTVFGITASAAGIARAQATTDLVYLGLSKDIREGTTTAKHVKTYKCNVPPGPGGASIEMRKITAPLTLPFFTHQPCDEDGLNGVIKTTWTILLRVGPASPTGGFIPFGTHAGSGTYTDSKGNVARVSFAGTVGCGTHRDPFMDCERCREHFHFEGWMTGKYVSGPIYNVYTSLGLPAPQLKASYTGNFKGNGWPTPTVPTVSLTVQMMMDGVYAFNCGG